MFELLPAEMILSVRVQPGSKRNEVRGMPDGTLKVYVTQAPEKGKANKAVRKQLAESLGLRQSQIELLSGETISQKKFLLRNIDTKTIQQKIDSLTQ
jgi:uncharacterized protein (TIGR00251 family)